MECRWPAPALEGKRLTENVVADLSRTFRVLSDPTRIRILSRLLSDGERPVGELARELGMTTAAVSGQLRKMADLGFLAREGRKNFVYYRVVDPCVAALLHRAYCLARDAKSSSRNR